MRIVVGLLYQAQLLALIGIESTFDTVSFLQIFQGQNQNLGVVLVVQRWEGNRGEAAALW